MRPMRTLTLALALATLLLAPAAFAQDGTSVEIPLDIYEQIANGNTPNHTVGSARMSVSVNQQGSNVTAEVTTTITAEIFESEWTSIVVLPPGIALQSARNNGSNVRLIAGPDGLVWVTNRTGAQTLTLTYTVDAVRYEGGYSVALPVPPSASTDFDASIPGSGLGVAVIPSTSPNVTESGSTTSVSATIPAVDGIQLSWRTASEEAFVMSRATYTGTQIGESIQWTAQLDVEVNSGEEQWVPVLSDDLALHEVLVDTVSAPISVDGGQFTVPVQGRGSHTLTVTFEVPIERGQGPPGVEFDIPRVPVSRFELVLPGDKDISVTPESNVALAAENDTTRATVHVAMTSSVSFRWPEAVPEGEQEEIETRANAQIYHLAHAEEGVLYVRAVAEMEVTRGETNQFGLVIPDGVEVHTVESPMGGIVDWRTVRDDLTGVRTLEVYLDRQVQGTYRFDVRYERLLGIGEQATEVDLPLVSAVDVTRQRGMVALLASREVALEPTRQERVTEVGENQLPAELHNEIELTVANTFRYVEENPVIGIVPTVPERQQGRFDADVDTLVSLGDVTTTCTGIVQIDVKSGSIMDLRLLLPEGVSFLNLSAPSLRGYDVETVEGRQSVEVEFTQEMEGQFRIEVTYERIAAEDDGAVEVPLLHVEGVDVEQGRIAVEALSAVEVQPAGTSNLSTIDISELPQQLILRTTNPILLAYRYVQSNPPPALSLEITRHREIDVQAASIDDAQYRMLITEEGLAVTSVRYMVRNSREQFLRLELPAGAEIWSAAVNGEAETPASEDGAEGDAMVVLINIINSQDPFPVDVTYAAPVDEIGRMGRINALLAHPEIVVASTRLELYVPEDLTYGDPRTSMNLVDSPEAVSLSQFGQAEDGRFDQSPVQISLRGDGRRYEFEQLYASPSDGAIAVVIPYRAFDLSGIGKAVSAAGGLLLALGLFLGFRRRMGQAVPVMLLGIAGLVVAPTALQATIQPGLMAGGVTLGVLVIGSVIQRLSKFGKPDDPAPTPSLPDSGGNAEDDDKA